MSAVSLLGSLNEDSSLSMDKSDVTPIAKYLKSLGAQPTDLLRFFDRKDFFSLHGRDAHTVAVEYFKNSGAVKHVQLGDERHAYLTINKNQAKEVMRLALLQQKRRVEEYRLEGREWACARRGSPGNLQPFADECQLDAGQLDASAVIAAVRVGKTAGSKGYAGNARLVGVAFVDAGSHSIRCSEFEDDEHFSTLESLVCQQATKEGVLPPDLGDGERQQLAEVLELCEVPHVDGKKGSFSTKDYEQDLRRLLGKEELHGRAFESSQLLSIGAACGLLKYLDVLADADSHGQWTLEWVEPAQFMRLDSGAMRALSVDPQPGEADKNASLLGIFSQCKTAMGSRLLRKWLRQPLVNAHDIGERHDLVDAFVHDQEMRLAIRDECLPQMGGDLDRTQRKLASGKAQLQVTGRHRRHRRHLHHCHRHLTSSTIPSAGRRLPLPVRAQAAEAPPDAQLPRPRVRRRGRPRQAQVRRAAPPRPRRLRAVPPPRRERRRPRRRPPPRVHRASVGGGEPRVPRRAEGGLPRADRRAVRGDAARAPPRREDAQARGRQGGAPRVPRDAAGREADPRLSAYRKMASLGTKKDGVIFRDKALERVAEEYYTLCADYAEAQKAIVEKVVRIAATFTPVISDAQELIAELDVLLCFAAVALCAPEPYVRPKLVAPEDGAQRIVFEGLRHPCVERMEGVSFIKNGVSLVGGESTLQVVTGPNMGGKSTYIRSVGVAVLLAQIGSFVPADAAEISVCDSILARVGAGDVQARGISTFMAEMLESATILKCATPQSS